jgi:hypothetical protein
VKKYLHVIGITGTINTAYRIESRTSLTGGSWTPVGTNSAQRFFRVREP